jgi:hypothetical protein
MSALNDYVTTGIGSFIYCSRVWPGTTMFLFVLIGRLIDWPGMDGATAYVSGIALLLLSLFLTWRGDDHIDFGSKAFVDVKTGWRELSDGFLSKYEGLEYVPITVVPAEGSRPLAVLPSGLRIFLPPMGTIFAYWVRRPAVSDPAVPRQKMPPGPRAYPFASYRTYVFLNFSPDSATAKQRFQLFHEIGHALFARSFQSIGHVQTWPCLIFLIIGTLIVSNMALVPSSMLIAMLILWWFVMKLRSTPTYERERFSEFCADFYAILHTRDTPEIHPYLVGFIDLLRAHPDPAKNQRADDLEMLLNTFPPILRGSESALPGVNLQQLLRVHQGHVRKGSQHPPLLLLLLAICLASTGISLAWVAPQAMLIFALLYALIPYLIWRFGTGRRNALEAGRVDRLLWKRRSTDGTTNYVPLTFS